MGRYVVQLAPETAQRFWWVGKSGTNIKGFYRSVSTEASCSLPLRADYFSPCSLLSTHREKWKKDQTPKENEKQVPRKSMRKKSKTITPTTKQPQD